THFLFSLIALPSSAPFFPYTTLFRSERGILARGIAPHRPDLVGTTAPDSEDGAGARSGHAGEVHPVVLHDRAIRAPEENEIPFEGMDPPQVDLHAEFQSLELDSIVVQDQSAPAVLGVTAGQPHVIFAGACHADQRALQLLEDELPTGFQLWR